MKLLTFSLLSFAFLASATPLGDRSLAQRHAHNGIQISRRFLLARLVLPLSKPANAYTESSSSRVDAPAACAVLNANSTSVTPVPDSSSNSTSNTNSTVPPEIVPLSDSSAPPAPPTSGNGAHVTTRSTFSKRIAQTDLPDVALQWQNLCLTSGGPVTNTSSPSDPDSSPCVTLAGLGGLDALLADADPCAQQDIADQMIDFAKSPSIDSPSTRQELIDYAIKYRKHPRNALNILGVVPSTPYCQKAPKSQELVGVFNDQLEGVDKGVFGGPKFTLVPFGADGTCPFGQTPDVSTCTCLNSTSTTNSTSTSTPTATAMTATITVVGDSPLPVPTSTTTSPSDDSSNDGSSDDSADNTSDGSSDDDSGDNTSDDTSDDSDSDDPPSTTDPTSSDETSSTDKTPGPVFQPDDIDGDVNDPEGKR